MSNDMFYLKADRLNDGTPRVLEYFKDSNGNEGRVDEDVRKQNAVAYARFISYVKDHKDEVTKKAIEDLKADEQVGQYLPEHPKYQESSQGSKEAREVARQHDVQLIPTNAEEEKELALKVETKKRTQDLQKIQIVDPKEEAKKAKETVDAKAVHLEKADKPIKSPKKGK